METEEIKKKMAEFMAASLAKKEKQPAPSASKGKGKKAKAEIEPTPVPPVPEPSEPLVEPTPEPTMCFNKCMIDLIKALPGDFQGKGIVEQKILLDFFEPGAVPECEAKV